MSAFLMSNYASVLKAHITRLCGINLNSWKWYEDRELKFSQSLLRWPMPSGLHIGWRSSKVRSCLLRCTMGECLYSWEWCTLYVE